MGLNGEHKSDSEGETTSQSSEEAVISTELPAGEGNKKGVQAKLDASPVNSNKEGLDAEMQVDETEGGVQNLREYTRLDTALPVAMWTGGWLTVGGCRGQPGHSRLASSAGKLNRAEQGQAQ